MDESREDAELLLAWFIEAFPEHVENIKYIQDTAGEDPLPIITSPQTLKAYASWRIDMRLGDLSQSYQWFALGQAGLFVQRAQAEGRLPADCDVWVEFCFGIASDTARDAHLLHLVREGARWRENERSPKQEALARKLGVRLEPWWRSGEVSDAIAAVTGDWYD